MKIILLISDKFNTVFFVSFLGKFQLSNFEHGLVLFP